MKNLLLFVQCISFSLSVLCQTNTMPTITSATPASPNAAALGKFGEIPVGLYTGIPNISIPIYEINTGKLSLPISIVYHAGGVKIEDIASWVGLGWALETGGCITRQVRGIADEGIGGYLEQYGNVTKYLKGQMGSQEQQDYLESIADQEYDSQQDLFFYSFGTQSGKFIFDSTGQTIGIPNNKYKTEFGTFYGITECWKITDLNGVQYYFLNKEKTRTTTVMNGELSSTPNPIITTSWLLSKGITQRKPIL